MQPTKGQEIYDKLPSEAKKSFAMDNSGNLVYKNRAYRRRFEPDDPDATKKTWKRQSKKDLKRKRKLGRR
jgi:hypothetical protein